MKKVEVRKPFHEHIDELKRRSLICLVSVGIAVIGVYQFHEPLLRYLINPLHQELYYNAPIGALSFTFSVVMSLGLFLASPVIGYQIFAFIEPALPPFKRKYFYILILAFMLLFITGLVFGYVVSLPVTIHFFSQFSTPQLKSLITTDEYFSFVGEYLISFGAIFEIPILIVIINYFHKLDAKWLFKKQRYVILLSFLAGAILTPDPLNQTILAVPVILLYDISAGLVWLINRKVGDVI